MLLVSTAFTALQLLTFILFSPAFDWGGRRVYFSDPHLYQTREESTDIETLDPAEEDLLTGDSALSPAEVLSLDREIRDLGAVSRKPAESIPTETLLPPARLTAPENASPARLVDLRRRNTARLHWDPVTDAQGYRIEAWTFEGSRRVPLIEEVVESTELHVSPGKARELHWRVAAVGEDGNAGPFAGPYRVGILR